MTLINLFVSTTEVGSTFACESNITSINNMRSDLFLFDDSNEIYCYFKKSPYLNLILICIPNKEISNYYISIKNVLDCSNKHYIYDFYIQPVNITPSVEIGGLGLTLNYVYPETLNFYESSLVTIRFFCINYIKEMPEFEIALNFSNIFKALKCEDNLNMKKCVVNYNQLVYNESKYYFIYHLNHKGGYSRNYDVFPMQPKYIKEIEIKLEDYYNTNTIIIGEKGTLYIITSYKDTDNIFNVSDIENKTIFQTRIVENDTYYYNVKCRLWKPKDDFLRLFCDFNIPLSKKETILYFYTDIISFSYNNIKININSYLTNFKVKKSEKTIPFLYSDKQNINIIYNQDIYELKFKIGKYNNETIFLNGEGYNSICLSNYTIEKNELIIKINKENLEEILQAEEEHFIISTYIDSEGLININNILDIIIKEENIIKEGIYIGITKLLTKAGTLKEFMAYETNITDIPNVISNMTLLKLNNTDISISFKKAVDNPLLMLFMPHKEGKYSLGEIKEEIIYDNIHSKFNFIILPVKNDEIFEVKGESTFIYNNYPEFLNFTLNDTLTVNYYLKDKYSFESIKLNLESEKDLECEQNINLMKCIIPKSHFTGKYNGYYYTYHLNNLNEYSPFYFTSPIKIFLENKIILNITEEYNKFDRKIGQNGTIAFITDYNDTQKQYLKISDLEEKSKFETKLIDEFQREHNVTCRLWNPINENIVILCNLRENLTIGSHTLKLSDMIFFCDDYNISIYSKTPVKVERFDYDIPFIYSDEQIINIKDDINIYELKFKYGYYNKNILYLSGNSYLSSNFILGNCKSESNEIICYLSKNKLESILSNENEVFNLETLNENYGVINFKFVYNINIKHEIKEKEDIFVKITNLLNNISESGNAVPYNTNISYIDNLHSSQFLLGFYSIEADYNCYFKKNNFNNLLLMCIITDRGDLFLGDIKEEIILNNIHYKYNFRIQPVKNYDIIHIDNYGTLVEFLYPDILDFSYKNISYLYYKMSSPSNSNNIKFNCSSFLSCENLNSMKKCFINIDLFNSKKNGFYYSYHLNHLNSFSIYYDVNPINIIFEEEITIEIEDKDNDNLIKIGKNGILYLVTNYYDNDNIFDSTKLENINFKGSFSDNIKNKIYEPNCKLWKPLNENIRLICKFNESLENKDQEINIYINNVTFIYIKEINITITSKAKNIRIKQLTTDISFLYSDKQIINIEDTKNIYHIIFKQELYDNMPLYLYTNDIKYLELDNCLIENEELNCIINTSKLSEILSYSGESYYLLEKHYTEGLYIISSVFNISFNYQKYQENINVTITQLLTHSVAKNEFVAYETNVENIPKIITDYFDIKQESKEILNCIFKKNENRKNLLLLCNATEEGDNLLGKISPITLDRINVHYIFNLQESINNEIFNVRHNKGAKITSVYPLELNFSEKDSLVIKYEIEKPETIKGIKLNSESPSELSCSNKIWYKECTVWKNHFTNNGIYYTYHSIDQDIFTISYEIPPIKVTLKEIIPSKENKDDNNGLIIGITISVIIIIVALLIFAYLRSKKGRNNTLFPEEESPLTTSGSRETINR